MRRRHFNDDDDDGCDEDDCSVDHDQDGDVIMRDDDDEDDDERVLRTISYRRLYLLLDEASLTFNADPERGTDFILDLTLHDFLSLAIKITTPMKQVRDKQLCVLDELG